MPTRFVHLTDLHVNAPGLDDPGLLTDTTVTLRHALELIAALDEKPEFVVASGDLSNRGDAASYQALKEILDDLDVPLLLALGNHDTRAGFHEGYRGVASDAPWFMSAVHGGVHVITLDSLVPGRIGGNLDNEQFEFLARELDAYPDAAKLVIVHHPPDIGDIPDPDTWHYLDRGASDRLGAMLQGRHVAGVLSGHVHYDSVSIWNGVPLVTGAGLHAGTDKVRYDALRMVRSASIGLGSIEDDRLQMVFVPLPGNRELLRTIEWDALRAHDVAAAMNDADATDTLIRGAA
jgi:3',5'-cyclic AMP phosphodiesterase CpdA